MIISDRARACLLGAAVGDACGAPLENGASVSHEDAEKALCYPGGGPRGTETLICLYSALKAAPPFAGYPADVVANNLCEWYKTAPVACGRACALAFDTGKGRPVKTAARMRDDARLFSLGSQDTGALVRAAAVPVWGVCMGMTVLEIAEVARQDATLSHPSRQCVESNAVYCAALAYLLRVPGDAEGALRAAKLVCRDADVSAWLEPPYRLDAVTNGRHVEHAIALSAEHLRAKTPFRDAMYDVLRRGGDAAIVGAAMGALHGAIPVDLLKPVLEFAATGTAPRPEWLSIKRLLE